MRVRRRRQQADCCTSWRRRPAGRRPLGAAAASERDDGELHRPRRADGSVRGTAHHGDVVLQRRHRDARPLEPEGPARDRLHGRPAATRRASRRTSSSEGCWTGYVYNNVQYCTEINFGFHAWTLNEPWWENQLQLSEMNGQTNDAVHPLHDHLERRARPRLPDDERRRGGAAVLPAPAASQIWKGREGALRGAGLQQGSPDDGLDAARRAYRCIANAAGKLRVVGAGAGEPATGARQAEDDQKAAR